MKENEEVDAKIYFIEMGLKSNINMPTWETL